MWKHFIIFKVFLVWFLKLVKWKDLLEQFFFPNKERELIHSLEIKGFYILFTISNQTLQIFYILSNYYINSDFFFYWHGLIKTPVFLLLRLEDGMEAVDIVVVAVVVVVRSSWSCSTFSPFTKGSSSTSSLACWQAKVLQQKQQLRTTTEAANQDPSVTISSVPCGPPTSEVIFYYIYISVWQKKLFSHLYCSIEDKFL